MINERMTSTYIKSVGIVRKKYLYWDLSESEAENDIFEISYTGEVPMVASIVIHQLHTCSS